MVDGGGVSGLLVQRDVDGHRLPLTIVDDVSDGEVFDGQRDGSVLGHGVSFLSMVVRGGFVGKKVPPPAAISRQVTVLFQRGTHAGVDDRKRDHQTFTMCRLCRHTQRRDSDVAMK